MRWRLSTIKNLDRRERRSAYALACACCRGPRNPERDDLVRQLARDVAWGPLIDIARRHRIEGLVFEALRRAEVVPPPTAAERLRERAAAIAGEGLRQAAESVRLQAALDRAGIPSLLLKGVAIDVLAWGRIGMKQAWDIDLLVEETDVFAAAAVLAQLGYVVAKPKALDSDGWRIWLADAKESEWVEPLTGAVVELHWRLADTADLLPGLARSAARTVGLGGGSDRAVRTLGREETFAYLCVHGASHGWSRLKWVADVNALLERESVAERQALHHRAIALGAGRCSTVALMLCQQLFDLTLPPGFGDELRRDWRARVLAALAREAIFGGQPRDIAERRLLGDGILISHILFADGSAFRRRELRRLWLSLDDRLALRLPPALHLVYDLARIPRWARRRLRRPGRTGDLAPGVRDDR